MCNEYFYNVISYFDVINMFKIFYLVIGKYVFIKISYILDYKIDLFVYEI